MSKIAEPRINRLFEFARGIGVVEGESEQLRIPRIILTMLMTVVGILGIGWGSIYAIFDEPLAASLPLAYAGISAVLILVMRRTDGLALVLKTQLVLIVFLPFALAVSLGGFAASSGVVLWSLLGPITAFLSGERRGALVWLSIYMLLVVLLAALHPWLPAGNNLPTAVVLTFFALNIGAVSAITFGMIFYFVGENQRVHALLIRQEEEMRQTEKMSALGKISAGLAHELNNPAAAAGRASQQISSTLGRLDELTVALSRHALTEQHWASLSSLRQQLSEGAGGEPLGALERADLEEALGGWLESRGVSEPWELAFVLTSAGFDSEALESALAELPDAAIGDAIAWTGESRAARELADTIVQSTSSISELVAAVKQYSYMDQAPQQDLDIHDGLESTLTILGHKLKSGPTVVREYDRSLPKIFTAGGELNQVWTNILDNAIEAAGPDGEIRIITRLDGDQLLIEFVDNGPGVPQEIQSRVFDPFFTTKDVGEGTGLGLDVSRRIITERCGGQISLTSEPGNTRFQVRLPIDRQQEATVTQRLPSSAETVTE